MSIPTRYYFGGKKTGHTREAVDALIQSVTTNSVLQVKTQDG